VKRSPAFRALRYLGAGLLLFSVIEACSSGDDSPVVTALGPPSIAIESISPSSGAGSSSQLACDDTISVVLDISNWPLQPPGVCETSQCGQVRVRLLDGPGGKELAEQIAASAGVSLDLAALKPEVYMPNGSYVIEATLGVVDGAAFKEFVISTGGGNTHAQRQFDLTPPMGCPEGGSGGAPGEGGDGGFGGLPDFGSGGTGGVEAGAGGA
jgi:hypothetical protein